jgi:hypothetical protein
MMTCMSYSKKIPKSKKEQKGKQKISVEIIQDTTQQESATSVPMERKCFFVMWLNDT